MYLLLDFAWDACSFPLNLSTNSPQNPKNSVQINSNKSRAWLKQILIPKFLKSLKSFTIRPCWKALTLIHSSKICFTINYLGLRVLTMILPEYCIQGLTQAERNILGDLNLGRFHKRIRVSLWICMFWLLSEVALEANETILTASY